MAHAAAGVILAGSQAALDAGPLLRLAAIEELEGTGLEEGLDRGMVRGLVGDLGLPTRAEEEAEKAEREKAEEEAEEEEKLFSLPFPTGSILFNYLTKH